MSRAVHGATAVGRSLGAALLGAMLLVAAPLAAGQDAAAPPGQASIANGTDWSQAIVTIQASRSNPEKKQQGFIFLRRQNSVR